MKFYETHFEDYLNSLQKYNLHPELQLFLERFPETVDKFANIIITGPSGSGKYTQSLSILRKYSQSHLKYQKKITLQHEKYTYQYHISDIHYEIDMSLLGCNSKLIWHDIIQQIVDIVSVKPEKYGIILCKNFHLIHTELLDIFYSYMQEYNHSYSDIQLKYIIITEHISFMPNNILNSCEILRVCRPNKQQYLDMITAVSMDKNPVGRHRSYDTNPSKNDNSGISIAYEDRFVNEIANYKHRRFELENIENIIANLDDDNPGILNIKELNQYSRVPIGKEERMPNDNFNIICDSVIKQLLEPEKLVYTTFRDVLYDMFIYNLDVIECLCYILFQLILNGHLSKESISRVTQKIYGFLKYFNNNYRPIYHLEYIMYSIQREIFL